MHALTRIVWWFAGGSVPYHTLYHCMRGDKLWVALTVALDLTVGAGYGLIALHWWRNERRLPDSAAKRALGNMKHIFIFCCICGYMFIPIKMFWPAWRLYDVFMAFLVFYTWRYALRSTHLKVVYNEIGRSEKLAADLAESREQGRQKTAFFNAISHDLRTPLNAIVLQSQVGRLGLEQGDVDTMKLALADIETNARAAGELLEGLLQCARLDRAEPPNQFTEFAARESLTAAMSAFRHAATEQGLALLYDCPADLALYTDRTKLERAVSNLLQNAIKFTPAGSVRIMAERGADGVKIHVIDTGIGIAEFDQPRLFDEFYQVQNHERDRRKGFGLGLPIAKRLVRQLGGDIGVESSPGRGSRFTLLLPRTAVRAKDSAAVLRHARNEPAATETAVVAG
jgi:signal transduction histidine kinase